VFDVLGHVFVGELARHNEGKLALVHFNLFFAVECVMNAEGRNTPVRSELRMIAVERGGGFTVMEEPTL